MKINSVGGSDWFPGLVLAGGLVLTLFASYYAARAVRLQERMRFEASVREAQTAIETRMESYLALLRGGAALLAVNTNLERSQFHAFVSRLELQQHYPGIQGFGFSARIRPGSEAGVQEAMRRQGHAAFHFWPEADPGERNAILFLEPQDARNQEAIGFNMASEARRRETMDRARDSGTATLSGKVVLVQEIEGSQEPGFLIYVPVYRGGDVPDTVEERRARLEGFIYAPFRAVDLFQGAFLHHELTEMNLEVFDGPAPEAQALLFRTERHKPGSGLPFWTPFALEAPLELAGHRWTFRFEACPGLGAAGWLAPGVLLAGLVLSLVLYSVNRAEARARGQAEEAASRLRVSEQSLRQAREKLQNYAQELEVRVVERTTRLQESLQSLEGVLYHVAHDLRAPLRAMASFTNILAADYSGSLDTRGQDYVRRVCQGAQRMDELVRDLLAYGRLGHIPMPLGPVSLQTEVRGVLDRLAIEIRDRGANVDVQRPLPRVQATIGVLKEVLMHLVSNALKFVGPGQTPQIRIWAVATPSTVRLWVQDNGIGIPPEYQERIFRVFERLHPQESYSGTGIGLAIVRKGIERMGGHVGVESAPGQGSRFWIELAASEPDNPPQVG